MFHLYIPWKRQKPTHGVKYARIRIFSDPYIPVYSQVSNRRGVWNSRGGLEKNWLLNCFFLSFSNHENYSIKNICVYSKSKIKPKVTNKQNPEHLKMINWRLFCHKFSNNSKMLLSSSWAIFIRALVFSFSPRANFSSFKYFCFSFLLVFQFIFI